MNFTDILTTLHIGMNIVATDRNEAIKYALLIATRNANAKDVIDDVQSCLLEREAARPSGFGKGVAIPHTFAKMVPNVCCGIVLLKNPIDWNSVDGVPVNLVGLVVGPPEMMSKYVKVLLRCSKLLSNDDVRNKVLAQTNTKAIHDILKEEERKLL